MPNVSSSVFDNAIAGSLAGATTAVITCPLDVVKARMQVQILQKGISPKYSGIIRSATLIAREEGFRGLYKGLSPTLMALSPSWAVYFTTYEWTKRRLREEYRYLDQHQKVVHLLASVFAGSVNAIALSPIWVVRTRLQLQTSNKYKSVHDCIRKIYRHEGLRSFYAGLAPSFFGLIHVGVQFPVYEYFKEELRRRRRRGIHDPLHHDSKLPIHEIIGASALSKMIASMVAYPHEVLRTRMQHAGANSKSIGCLVSKMFREEGLKSFYRGMSVNLVRVVPAAAITFTTFELVMSILNPE
ncbi:mitochondrial solute carrier family 25 (mitochondrial folate transporter) member 32 [Andalucia godoyi]|uniref:Mitochondrial solute carrier family 25 (Mitochondrial folate transporter) member 32 n=1 Tax=Andalucia godoyi TaxID=505711 RepID=A0A8K0AI74_ANDGO|nr:mitochondrial solute carrier family 25 (mitochondrial folate transporter) member 32 [Andalucia godoyi]|eukprot:ANDGO_03308.mRNA.1 mitochondrial solute carrier family 25 (mitochondrial folate transporter) member 32